jgi:uncharacterized protein affecting Mg2+/Co2+ transport
MDASPGSSEPDGPGRPPDAAEEHKLYVRFGVCGSRIALQQNASPGLQLAASLPIAPLRGTDEPSYTRIDMSVQNLTDSAVQVLTLRSGARMALTKNGIVVAGSGGVRPAGTQYKLAPGATHHYKSTLNLVSCATNSGLEPGHYQLHALQRFLVLDEHFNHGPTILVYGGPWDLEVR